MRPDKKGAWILSEFKVIIAMVMRPGVAPLFVGADHNVVGLTVLENRIRLRPLLHKL